LLDEQTLKTALLHLNELDMGLVQINHIK
jgi:hypothetical protein